MVQNNAGIFDLLLGPISSDSSVAPSGSPIQGDPFGSMLQLLMNRQQGSGAVSAETVDWAALLKQQSGAGVDAQQNADPFGLVLDRTTFERVNRLPISMLGAMPSDAKSASAMIDDIEIPDFGFNSASTGAQGDLAGEIPGAVASDDTSDAGSETDATKIANLTGREIAALLANRSGAVSTSQTVAVSQGTYRILDTAVKQDTLELTVSPEDSPTEVIKISLPLDIVDDFAVDVSDSRQKNSKHNPMRVALHDTGADASKVSQLLARLNLKALRITSTQSETTNVNGLLPVKTQTASGKSNSDATGEKFGIELTGERLSKSLSVQRELPMEAISARMTVVRSTVNAAGVTGTRQNNIAQSAAPVPGEAAMKSADGSLTSGPKEFFGLDNLARRLDAAGRKFEPTLTGTEKLTEGQSSIESSHLSSNSIQQSHSSQSSAESRTQSPVRFTLPDDIQTGLRPGGRAVTISIDPENIGPARLHLALRDSALTARVTVDTPQARAMVEQSLDQLTQQLQRAGIKVDLIEVNVAGDQARQQFHERNFGMRSRLRMRDLDNDSIQAADSPAPTVLAAARVNAVGPHGVNLYA
ncbi:flagellar hook-length control protein FliK [bacterium]|nr:flagellar hook-length control protein FliK [bacterium]